MFSHPKMMENRESTQKQNRNQEIYDKDTQNCVKLQWLINNSGYCNDLVSNKLKNISVPI